jgi:predicted nucleotidyltransferase
MEKRLNVALHKAIAFLEKNRYGYAVIGGIAMAQWGYVRATYDIDIKVLVPETEYDAISKAIRKEFPQPARENLPQNPLIISVTIDHVIVDFLLALPGYEEEMIERAVLRDAGGRAVWICSAEDLIIQKAVAGRARDWPDIEALLIEQLGKMDEAYIENWLSQFAEALEKPEILSQYKDLLQKVKSLS